MLAVENGVRTLYIGDYFEAELGSGTAFPVFVPDLDNIGLPNKFYLPIVKNGAGTITPPPANPGNGFYFTHPIHPNQSTITWRMYYSSGDQRVAMRISHGPTTDPYPAPGATQDEVYYLLSDHLGSTTVTVNQDGSVKSKVRYDAWGKTRYTSGTTPTDRKYTGQIEEATVGLYFYNARYYDPSLGRFIQPDSIIPERIQGIQASDRYAYSNNNPIRYSDSSGHCIGPLLPFCLMAATFIVDNAAIIASVAISGAILSFVGPSDPDPVLINDPIASQEALDNSTLQAYGWLTLGQAALEFSSIASSSIKSNVPNSQASTENTYCRYCSKAELEAINETGYLRGSRPGKTYFTTDNYSSALEAEEKLSLPSRPDVKVGFTMTNSPRINGPTIVEPLNGHNGGGIEYWSNDPVQVLIQFIQKLQ